MSGARPKPRAMRADDPPRPLAEVLPELRQCATSWEPQVALVGNVRADEVTRAVDAAFLAQRVLTFISARVPVERIDDGGNRFSCVGCSALVFEDCLADCWAEELRGLVEEMREVLR